MTAWQGFLIKDVGSREEYEKAVQYAEALGVLRKEFRAKGCFFVSRMDQMGVYFRNQAQRRKQLMQQEGAGWAEWEWEWEWEYCGQEGRSVVSAFWGILNRA